MIEKIGDHIQCARDCFGRNMYNISIKCHHCLSLESCILQSEINKNRKVFICGRKKINCKAD